MKNSVDKQKINRLVEASIKKRVFLNEVGIIKSKRSNQSKINEDIAGIANKLIGSDLVADIVKKFLIEKTLTSLGVDENSNRVMFTIVSNIFEAVDYKEITKYFGEDSCDDMMEVVTEAIIETVTELGSHVILSYVAANFMGENSFISPEAIAKGLHDISSESLNKVVVGLVQGILQEPLEKIVCQIDMSDVVSKSTGFDVGGLLGDKQGSDLGAMDDILGTGMNIFNMIQESN